MRRKCCFLIASLICSSQVVFGQLPDTDIWLFPLDKKAQITGSLNITNRPGYDNQPSFSVDGKSIYYTSIREDKQADIYLYAVKSKKTKQLTKTIESEYSPVESPVNNCLSVVTVLKDSSQVVQLLSPKSFTTINSSLTSSVDSVGYYHFLNADTVLYYKLTQPHSLRYHVITTQSDGFLCEHPCRTFKAINRTQFLFGIKDSAATAYYLYDTQLQKAALFARSEKVNEDIWWHSKYGLLTSEGATILQYRSDGKNWQVLFDLSKYGVKKITRFAFDPKDHHLVIVNNL
jgi:hypothetical protein